MSAVHAVRTAPAEPEPNDAEVEVQAMQDVLYDILATGLDPDQSEVPSEAIERFLHEHARSPKAPEEFRAFFALHGLSLRARAERPRPELALPPLERPELTLGAASASSAPSPAMDDEADTGAHALGVLRKPAPQGSRWQRLAVLGAFPLAAAGLAVALWQGYATLGALRSELERTREDARRSEREVQALREREAGLQSSVAANAALLQRVDQKSELLLESWLAERAHEGKKHH